MSLAALASRRPIAVIVFALLLSVLGATAWRQLPIDLLPDLKSPTVLVLIRSGDRPAEHMERWYGERIERRLFTVQDLKSIDQVAYSGKLISRLTFSRDTDVDLVLVDVNRALASLAADPLVDELRIRRDDTGQRPIVVLGMTAEPTGPGLAELSSLARRQLARSLERLEGVAEVRVGGGREREIQVVVDPVRLRAYGLAISEVGARIRASNVDFDVGTLEDDGRVLLVRADTRFDGPQDIENTVVRYLRSAHGVTTAVRISDIADVRSGYAQIRNLVRVNGREGVGLFVYKAAGANTVSVSRRLREAIADLETDLPGVDIEVISDDATQIEGSIGDVQFAAGLGVILAVLVLAAFLRSIGPIVTVAAAVPVSLLATSFAMDLAGQSLNLMTLGGLALGAGMLVDNSIVVIENIFRRRAAGESPLAAAASGAAFVSGAITISTLTTCVVFLPVIFVDGLAARFVAGISFTVVVSLLASLLVAILLIPALSVFLLPRRAVRTINPGANGVERTVYALLGTPVTVCLVAALLVAVGCYSLVGLGTQLLPPAQPNHFGLRVTAPAGQSVESTETTVAHVEEVLALAAGDHLAAMLSEVGQLDEDDRVIRENYSAENTAEVFVRLDADGAAAASVVNSSVSALGELYGVEIDWQLASTAFAQAMGTDEPDTVIEIRGESLSDLRTAAADLVATFAAHDAFLSVRSSFEGQPRELHLRLRRELADGLGVSFDTIRPVLEAALDGLTVSQVIQGDETQDVLIALPPVDLATISRLRFLAPGGQSLTIGDVADMRIEPGARKILRRDQRRIAEVTALSSPGLAAPEVRAVATALLAQVELPAGVGARLAGEELEREQTLSELRWVALLALMLVVMVLAASFESLLHPITILTAIPLSLIGVAATMVPLGQPLGVMAALGFVVLVGIAVNNAILLIMTGRKLIDEGASRRRALAQAASVRLRPIVMTTATTVLALMPLALFGGDAAQIRNPLAWTVIGGIVASTLGCLIVIPCVYMVLDDLGRGLARLAGAGRRRLRAVRGNE